MPAQGSTAPGTRQGRVLTWYHTHPGFHRCRDVAAALGEPVQPVAVASRKLMMRGDIQRRYEGTRSLYGISANHYRGARLVDCPVCEQPAGQPCIDTRRSDPERVHYMKHHHRERIDVAKKGS